jgi:DNA-binding transcriptional MerR regulator
VFLRPDRSLLNWTATGVSMTTYTIGELAQEFDVTTRAIRFYEDQGLLSPTRNGQARIYSARDRVRLKLVLRGKRLGFSLGEVGEMLDLYDADPSEIGQLQYFVSKLDERRAQLNQQQQDIQVTLKELDDIEAQCKALLVKKRAS